LQALKRFTRIFIPIDNWFKFLVESGPVAGEIKIFNQAIVFDKSSCVLGTPDDLWKKDLQAQGHNENLSPFARFHGFHYLTSLFF
jgi:hypothetical protein